MIGQIVLRVISPSTNCKYILLNFLSNYNINYAKCIKRMNRFKDIEIIIPKCYTIYGFIHRYDMDTYPCFILYECNNSPISTGFFFTGCLHMMRKLTNQYILKGSQLMNTLTCGFIGLGLIGGSIAKAVRSAHPDAQMIAYDVNETSLQLAKKEKVIDQICTSVDGSFHHCDYIFLCAPVSHNDDNLFLLKEHLSPGTILTDVGSVKTGIHRQIEVLGLQDQFIGGHPMTGSERFGYQNSKASLLENAYYILTPSDTVPQNKLSAYRSLVEQIGAIPLILGYEEHDYVTAAISHLPHVIAASLVNLVKQSDSEEGVMKMIAAGGFKDITRIASSSPAMWQQICMTNGDNILKLLKDYIQCLTRIQNCIDARTPDALYEFFDSARNYRESFTGTASGPIQTEHVLTVDIADKPGAIAAIASLLAMHEVSIKNIGINHNRELAEGALRIEFYGEEAARQAIEVMTAHGYKIHTKK